MLGKGGGIDQAHALADRLGFLHGVLPPFATPEAAAVVVGKPLGRKIIGAFPAIDPAELRASGRLPVIGGRCAQGPARGAFLVGVVEDVDVFVGLFILAGGEFGGHPVAVALGVERCHIDLRLTFDHELREIIAGAARCGDPERKAFGQPHVAQAGRRTHQRVAIGRVADRPVEIVLQTAVLRRGDAVVHGHVLILDPV